MTFKKPRILSDSEANTIRGKCLVAAASPAELMQLIGHFDLVDHKLRSALEALRGCMEDRIYVYDDKWSSVQDSDIAEEDTVVIDFTEILGE